jgi:hypothetical protein
MVASELINTDFKDVFFHIWPVVRSEDEIIIQN